MTTSNTSSGNTSAGNTTSGNTTAGNKAQDFRTVVQSASGHAQAMVGKVETTALAAVDRIEDAVKSSQLTAKAGLETVKAASAEVLHVADNAGRTTISATVALNGSLMTYGRDLIADTIEVSRKSIESRSLADVVQLQTAYTERRITAAFQTMAAINTLAQQNVLAAWAPLANLVNRAATQVGGQPAQATVGSKAVLKTAA